MIQASGLGLLMWVVALIPIIAIGAYVTVRAASFAHFRTKLEYLRRATREQHDFGKKTTGEDENGKI